MNNKGFTYDATFGDKDASRESLFQANWISPFHWLRAEDRGPRFLEWLEDVKAKFDLIDWPEKDDLEVKKRKAFLGSRWS